MVVGVTPRGNEVGEIAVSLFLVFVIEDDFFGIVFVSDDDTERAVCGSAVMFMDASDGRTIEPIIVEVEDFHKGISGPCDGGVIGAFVFDGDDDEGWMFGHEFVVGFGDGVGFYSFTKHFFVIEQLDGSFLAGMGVRAIGTVVGCMWFDIFGPVCVTGLFVVKDGVDVHGQSFGGGRCVLVSPRMRLRIWMPYLTSDSSRAGRSSR